MDCWGNIPPGLYEHSCVVVGHEMVVLCGCGQNGKTNAVYSLSLETHKWTVIFPETQDREIATEPIDGQLTCLVPSNSVIQYPRILIFGGRNNSWSSNNNVWLFHLHGTLRQCCVLLMIKSPTTGKK